MNANGNEQLLKRLKALECRDATFAAKDPSLVMDKGLGSLVFDAEGREFIDLCAGFGALALGHHPEEHADVFKRRLAEGPAPVNHGMGDVYPSVAKVELVETLAAMLPKSLGRVALALTGAQAVEIAVKTALLATGKSGFIAFQGGYHGLDLGVLPLTARADFRAPFERYCVEDRVEILPFHADLAALEDAARRLEEQGAGLAGVLVEPVQGRAGIRPAGDAWLETLRGFASAHGALLIYDEVFAGLGRAGSMTRAAEIPADLVCFGKALGGGFPLSACVGTETAMNAWPESPGEALHTGTFFGHPFACEIATATLKAIGRLKLDQRAREIGAQAKAWLRTEFKDNPAVLEVRGEGLMLGIVFREAGAGARLMDALRAQGVIALAAGDQGEVLSITPALNIAWSRLEDALVKISRLIRKT